MKNLKDENNTIVKKYPGFMDFFSSSIDIEVFLQDELLDNKMSFDEKLGYNTLGKMPAFAALYKKPPTNCVTPGRMRPGGYTRSGKIRPPKYIHPKTDRRAGK